MSLDGSPVQREVGALDAERGGTSLLVVQEVLAVAESTTAAELCHGVLRTDRDDGYVDPLGNPAIPPEQVTTSPRARS